MGRTPTTFRPSFLLLLAVTLAIALLPASARVGWSSDLGRIAAIPLRPFSHLINTVVHWFWNRVPEDAWLPAGTPETLRRIVEERDLAERRYLAEHQRVLELEEQIALLQALPAAARQLSKAPLLAQVARRTPADPTGMVELALPGGVETPPAAGSVVVYAGVHIVGRTLEGATTSTAQVCPLVHALTGPIRARIFPAAGEPGRSVLISLEVPEKGDWLAGRAPRDAVVGAGDIVRLDDPSWPATAQMMVLGEVTRIEPNDQEPLFQRVIIEPRFALSRLSQVTLIIEASP